MTASADRVVGLGQVTVEQIGVGPRSSEAVVELETFSIQAGGAVGTTLATVCALGGQASYFGRLSDDEFGSMITRGLKAFGVDMSSVLIEPGKISPTSFVLVDERTGAAAGALHAGQHDAARSGRAAAQAAGRRAHPAGRRPQPGRRTSRPRNARARRA